ncbi:MAG: hypothetical protein AAGD32_16910, partial [Planctomycetota bacterium]
MYDVPEDAGPFVVVTSKGEFAVADVAAMEMGAQAAKLGLLFIPCRDEAQAEVLAEQRNSGEH